MPVPVAGSRLASWRAGEEKNVRTPDRPAATGDCPPDPNAARIGPDSEFRAAGTPASPHSAASPRSERLSRAGRPHRPSSRPPPLHLRGARTTCCGPWTRRRRTRSTPRDAGRRRGLRLGLRLHGPRPAPNRPYVDPRSTSARLGSFPKRPRIAPTSTQNSLQIELTSTLISPGIGPNATPSVPRIRPNSAPSSPRIDPESARKCPRESGTLPL